MNVFGSNKAQASHFSLIPLRVRKTTFSMKKDEMSQMMRKLWKWCENDVNMISKQLTFVVTKECANVLISRNAWYIHVFSRIL